MSLTGILSSKRGQVLRDVLKTNFPKPKFDKSIEIVAPPITRNYALIGTAFDYLLRFYIEHYHPETQKKTWVAESALKLLMARTKNSNRIFYFQNKRMSASKFSSVIKQLFNEAESEYAYFVSTGKFRVKIFQAVLFLAQLEPTYRRGVLDPNIGVINKNDIKDLQQLIQLIPNEFRNNKQKWFLNPTFGNASRLVGGADADLIVGDILIDIKVTKKFDLTRPIFNQVLGYYLLSLMGGINGNKRIQEVRKVGVYFARHGFLLTLPISQFADKKKISTIKLEFIEGIMKSLRIKEDSLKEFVLREGYSNKNELKLYTGDKIKLKIAESINSEQLELLQLRNRSLLILIEDFTDEVFSEKELINEYGKILDVYSFKNLEKPNKKRIQKKGKAKKEKVDGRTKEVREAKSKVALAEKINERITKLEKQIETIKEEVKDGFTTKTQGRKQVTQIRKDISEISKTQDKLSYNDIVTKRSCIEFIRKELMSLENMVNDNIIPSQLFKIAKMQYSIDIKYLISFEK